MEITAINNPPRAPQPPLSQAPSMGGIATKTAARPPKAAKPIIPTLKRPAYPHCILTPKAIIALIRHRLRIDKDTFQLWKSPTPNKSNAIIAKYNMFLLRVIKLIFLQKFLLV